MSAYLDNAYLEWLYKQVSPVSLKNPERTNWKLLRQLYSKEFAWTIQNDENRAVDGHDLRYTFLMETGTRNPDILWLEMGCSMLEMILGMAIRYAFMMDSDPAECFWEILENMGIDRSWSNDANYDDHISRGVDDIMNRVINRTYSPRGEGGLFPVPASSNDQRSRELWYQLCEYVNDRL